MYLVELEWEQFSFYQMDRFKAMYDATTKITLDGMNVDLSQIRANDQIEIFVLSGKATEVKKPIQSKQNIWHSG